MRALDKKLFRDVWRMRMHAVGVALVLGCGLSVMVMAVGMRGSMERTRAAYYAERHMADVAVSLVRAPERIARQLAEAPGVEALETRVSGIALLDLPGVDEPPSARLVSLPPSGRPHVNDLALASGRWPDPARANEVLLSQAFADANRIAPGDRLAATMYGRRQTLLVVGVANSPEFVFVAAPGELFRQAGRFGVIWMGREALARAYDLDGAFNDVVLTLGRNANRAETIAAIDRILEPYGATGAYGRDRMISDRFLSEELRQLSTMATFIPALFLITAAFLVNIALGRVIATERSNIGLLKAFGYSNAAVAWHYAKSALIFAAIGAFLGSAAGVALGRTVADLYREYYHFPTLEFAASPATFLAAWSAGLAAAVGGCLVSVLRAARLAPAAALTPPRPTAFFAASGALGDFAAKLDAKSRIIMRRIVRFPRRAGTTSLGVAFAIALLVVARTFPAEMDYLLDVNFGVANRQDITLTFAEARDRSVLHQVERLPGVLDAEPFRIDDIVFRHNGRTVHEAIFGVSQTARLSRVVGVNQTPIAPPVSGLALARALAEKLGAHPGDTIRIEQTRGRRIAAEVRVSAIVEPMIGAAAYMELESLSRLLREPARISGAHIMMDHTELTAFNRAIKRIPTIAGASYIGQAETSMRREFEQGVGVMNLIYAAFAAIMAGGVAFSAARITLAEQERDLATLRVLGFTRTEVSYILIGELVALALLAVPAGVALGTLLAIWLMQLFQTDMYAFPFVFSPGGYAFAIAFTLACVTAASLLVRTGVDKLDMIGVLKARD
ncbi:MAG: FtsX-like permease family protein [Hyphomonadaceae bacterium]|nr:FtsX-like permease family protein [Hyphomonadaceae bacterium]